MAAVEVTITGMLYDKLNRTTQNVVLIGEASFTGLGVGGGPMPPGSGSPPSVWPGPGHPEHPIYWPPSVWPDPRPPASGSPPSIWPGRPTHPIVLPPEQVPPDMRPPEIPPPGSTTPVPPPAGSAGWPVQPVAVPPYVVLQYPGIGPIYVTPPIAPAPG